MKKLLYLLLLVQLVHWQAEGSFKTSLTELTGSLSELKDALELPPLTPIQTKKQQQPAKPSKQSIRQIVRLVRVVPMAFNKQNNQWSVLLGHDPGDFWSDFSIDSKNFQAPTEIQAGHLLDYQTNGKYKNSDLSRAVVRKTPNNDIVYFIPVNFISRSELYQQARTTLKDDFAWISTNEFLSGKQLSRLHNKKDTNVNRGVQNMLQALLPQVVSQLSSGAQQQRTSDGGSWLNIPGAIYFYDKKQPYYEFTNFALSYPITINRIQWPTTEHYYQAQKFTDKNLQGQIGNQPTARDAFELAQKNKSLVRPDWQQISIPTMLKALRAKFSQHNKLQDMLLNTGDIILVENAGKNDDFYGAGADGKGKNHLGQLLMHVRDELRSGVQKEYVPHKPEYYRK